MFNPDLESLSCEVIVGEPCLSTNNEGDPVYIRF